MLKELIKLIVNTLVCGVMVFPLHLSLGVSLGLAGFIVLGLIAIEEEFIFKIKVTRRAPKKKVKRIVVRRHSKQKAA